MPHETPETLPLSPVTAVYLAYGPPRLVQVAAFSALTFIHACRELPGSTEVAVYTDRPAVFRELGIRAELIPLGELQDRVPAYHFRTKITAMQHAADRFCGSLLLVDGDTYFKAPPVPQLQALARGRSVMHVRDCRLSSPTTANVIDVEKLAAAGVHSIRLPGLDEWPDWIWNSGVVGISEGSKHLIPEVLSVCDEIYDATGCRISEQMAWTLVLSKADEIVGADDVVSHYWGAKEQLMYEIVSFLRHNRRMDHEVLAAKAYELRPTPREDWRPPLSIRARIAARSGRQHVSQAIRNRSRR